MARRQSGYGASPRMKVEPDAVEFLGGVLAGETTGAPLAMAIKNADHARWKGVAVEPLTVPRPGHADLTGTLKYGYRDLRFALERASARETAARVAVGAVCRKLLAQFGVRVGSYVTEIGAASADLGRLSLEARLERVEGSRVRCPDPRGTLAMQAEIRAAMQARDTLGGVFEVVALGLPPGLGSYVHWDRRLSALLAAAVMSIHAIKGVEVGEGFAIARRRGTEAHDEIHLAGGDLIRRTNRGGGLEGGITTGEPLVLRAAMKPISTTLTPRASVDLASGQAAETRYERSDFCAVPRAAVVGEAMVCFVLAGALLEKLGGDSMDELQARYEALRRARLDDLGMSNEPIVFWE
jgi:chorismate synthase